MKTSIDNYFDRIKQIDVSKLPAPLAKGHDFAKKTSTGGTWKMYHASDTIKRVIDLYFEQLDEYIGGDGDKPKPPSTPAAAPKPTRTIEKEDTPRKQKSTDEILDEEFSKPHKVTYPDKKTEYVAKMYEKKYNQQYAPEFRDQQTKQRLSWIVKWEKEFDRKDNKNGKQPDALPLFTTETKGKSKPISEEARQKKLIKWVHDRIGKTIPVEIIKEEFLSKAVNLPESEYKATLSRFVALFNQFTKDNDKLKIQASPATKASLKNYLNNTPAPKHEYPEVIQRKLKEIDNPKPEKSYQDEEPIPAVDKPWDEINQVRDELEFLGVKIPENKNWDLPYLVDELEKIIKTQRINGKYIKGIFKDFANEKFAKGTYEQKTLHRLATKGYPAPTWFSTIKELAEAHPGDEAPLERKQEYYDTEQFNVVNEGNCYAVDFPIDKIYIDTKRFQNRKDAFSELSAQAVEKHFDANKFDPIILWKDKTGKAFVISGHSRLEGMKRRKAKHIPARFFEGTEQEAITFAKVEANRSQNREILVEDISAYILMRDGDKKKGIEPVSKEQIRQVFGSNASILEHFTFLNPNGLFLQALSSENTSEFPYLERTARWVGELRKKSDGAATRRITNLMEDNAFNFFYADKQGKNIKIAKDDFMSLVNKRLDTMKKSEKLLFTQDGQTINEAKRLLDDKLKGDGYRKLKEINELIRFIGQRLKTTDRKLKVWTKEEEAYLRKELGPKLEQEKARIEKDLNYLDKQQQLFGLNGIDCQCNKKKRRISAKPKRKSARRSNAKLNGVEKTAQVQTIKHENPPIYIEGLNGTVENPDVTATQETVTVTREETSNTKPVTLNGLPENVMGYFQQDQRKKETFTLPGKVGRILGDIEQHEYALVLRGDKGAGKTRFLHRLMNAFASRFSRIAFISLEIDQDSVQIDRLKAEYIAPQNQGKIFTTSKANTLKDIEEIAANFPVVVIDSWSKIVNAKPEDFDRIRKAYSETMFLVIFQSTTAGTARGGMMPEYDAQAVFHVHEGGYVITEKNRYGNGENIVYNVFTDELVDGDSVDLAV